jgi:hypothetical protein
VGAVVNLAIDAARVHSSASRPGLIVVDGDGI